MLEQASHRLCNAPDLVDEQLDALEDRLPRQFANPSASESAVREWVRQERRRFAGAKVRTFVPILVQRAVAERAGQPMSTAA